MAFTLPTFNLLCNVWTESQDGSGPPTFQVKGNLTPGRRVTTQFWDWADSAEPDIYEIVLLPALTDVRFPNFVPSPNTFSWMEVPAGTGRLYRVDFVFDIAKGFPNEHRAAVINNFGGTDWPRPIP